MFTIIRKMRCTLLFLLLLTVLFKESWALKDTTEDLPNDVTTLYPDREFDLTIATTLSLTDAELDNNGDNSNKTLKFPTTLADSTTITEDESFQTESTTPAEVVTEEAADRKTTLPNSVDDLKLEVDEKAQINYTVGTDPRTTTLPNSDDELKFVDEKATTDHTFGVPTDPSETNHKEGKVDTDNETLTGTTAADPMTEPPNDEGKDQPFENIDEEKNLSPDKIFKRILISSTPESAGDLINIDEFPEERLDAWRPLPVWSLPEDNSQSLKPTVRLPSVDSPYPYVESSLQRNHKTRNSYSVLKEPVTAYYFDLASVKPEHPVGPLFDPRIIRTRTIIRPSSPSNINQPRYTLQENLTTSFDDFQAASDDSTGSHNSKHPNIAIQPTPTQSKPVNTAEKSVSVSNINSPKIPSQITADDISSQNFESTTIASIYDRTATNFQKSTPAYTLGNPTDFHFTQGESNSVKNSTNTSDPDIMPSSLSSDQPWEIQNSTGDLRNKNKQSLTSASLFEIPIHPTDLPSPISLLNSRTQFNTKPTLMSRIPLWKRISQRKSLSELSVSKTTIVDTHERTVSPSTTSSTVSSSSIPFENDIPIGIFSPGILKYPVRTSNDNSIKENSETLKDIESLPSEDPSNSFTQFTASPTTPSLDSSIQSSTSQRNEGKHHTTRISIPHKSVNNGVVTPFENSENNLLNISPSFVHSGLSSSRKLGNSDTIVTEDSVAIMHDPQAETNIDHVSSTYTPRVAFDNSSLHLEGEFIPMFTQTPFTNQSFPVETDVNTKVAHIDDSFYTAPTTPINDVPLNESDFNSVNVADDSVNSHTFFSSSEKPAHPHPVLNEINSSSVEDKTEIKNNENTENFEENKVAFPSLFHNSTSSLSESFDNFTEKSTDIDQQPRNDSYDVPHEIIETESSPNHNLDDDKTMAPTTISSTSTIMEIIAVEDSKADEAMAIEPYGVGELVPKATDPPSEHATPSSITPVPTPPSKPAATNQPTLPKNPANLGVNIPRAVENLTSSDVPFSFAEKINEDQPEEIITVDVIPGTIPGDEPHLHLVKMHHNGTNSTHRSPFIKAEVLYDAVQFCQHQHNIENLLEEWINRHLTNSSNNSIYQIEIFLPPDCNNLYLSNNASSTDLENITYVYFYVKRNGEISPQSTRNFPKDPTDLEISQELNYLKDKIRSLELKESMPDPIIDDASSASLVVIVIVTSIIILLFLGGILACFMVKRRRTAETVGRRCTPAANDAYSLDSVSVFYHSLRRKSKKRASNKSLKSYLNQGFDDPNLPSRPLSFAKLTLFISDNEAIYDEFSNIPSVNPKYDEMPRGVEDKNRYANVIPVPETRILLGGSKITASSEYINANSIHGPKGELRYYIATQAPLDNTVADFWQMVWEQESKIIVMLTDFVEKGIDKCADYLPPSETLDCHRVYGEFQITLKSRDMRENYIMSLLQIKNLENNLVREIAHMWFTGWPQSGVPNEEKLFISFIFDVRTTRKQLRAKGPMIVHCSPGTGRTGTYITCDLCMRQFDDQKVVDIPKTVFRIRRERAGAVQTREQYTFIYRVVNLYAAKLTTGNLDSF